MTNEVALEKINDLIGYINNNEKNVVNYYIRKI